LGEDEFSPLIKKLKKVIKEGCKMYKKSAGIIIFILCISLSAWALLGVTGDPLNPDSLTPPSAPSDGGDDLNLPHLSPDGSTVTGGPEGGSGDSRGLGGSPAPQGIPDATSPSLPENPVQDFVDNLGENLGRTLQPLEPIGDIAQYVDPGEDLILNTADDRVHQIMVDPNTGILTDSIYRKIESPGVGWELQLEETRQYRFVPEEVMEEAKSNIPEEQISQAEEEGLLVGNWLALSMEEEAPDFYESLETSLAAQTAPEGSLTENDLSTFMEEVVGIEGTKIGNSYYAYQDNKLYRAYLENGRVVLDVFEVEKAGEIYDALNKGQSYGNVAATKRTYVYDKPGTDTPGYVTIDGSNYMKNTDFTLVSSREWESGMRIGVDEAGNFVDEYQRSRRYTDYTDYQFAEDASGNLLGFVRKNEKSNQYEFFADGQKKLTIDGEKYNDLLNGIKTPLQNSGLISGNADLIGYLLSDSVEIHGSNWLCKDTDGSVKAILNVENGVLKAYKYKSANSIGFWKEGRNPVPFTWNGALKSKMGDIDLANLDLSKIEYNFDHNRLIYQDGNTYYYVDYGPDNTTITHYGKIENNTLMAYDQDGNPIFGDSGKDISSAVTQAGGIKEFLEKFDITGIGTNPQITLPGYEEHPVSDTNVRDFAKNVLHLDEDKYTKETVDIGGQTYYIYEDNGNFYAVNVNVSGTNATVYQYTSSGGLQKLEYQRSGATWGDETPTSTTTLLDSNAMTKIGTITGKSVDKELFKDLITDIQNVNGGHNFKLDVSEDVDGDGQNEEGEILVGADEGGNFVGAVKQVGDNYTVYTTDGEYSFNKSDLDLGTIQEVLANGADDFIIRGSNGVLRAYKGEDNIWKGVGIKGDRSEGSLYFWKDLGNFGDKIIVINDPDNQGQGALENIWKGNETAVNLVKKLRMTGNNGVVKQLDENGYHYEVYKLAHTEDVENNIFNRLDSVIEVEARRLNPDLSAEDRAKMPRPYIKIGDIKIKGRDSILKLLGKEDLADVTADAILDLAMNIAYKQSGNQVVVGRDGGCAIWELEQKGSGSDTYYEVTGDGWTITQAQYEALRGKMQEAGIPDELQDLLNPDVSIDIDNHKIVIPVSHPEYGDGYAAKAFTLNNQTWEVSDDLTPMGRAYEQVKKIADVFQINAPSWDDFETNYDRGEIQTTDWKGKEVTIEVDPKTGHIIRISIGSQTNPQTGQSVPEQMFDLEWSEDGKSATVTGSYNGFQIRNGKLELNDDGSAKLSFEYSVNTQTQDGEPVHYSVKIKSERSLDNTLTFSLMIVDHPRFPQWESVTTNITYQKDDKGEWNITGKEEIYSSNTDFDSLLDGDYIRYVYEEQEGSGLDLDNITWKRRHGYEKMGDATAEWTETSENGQFTQGEITINGTRINRETGEIVNFNNQTVQRISVSELVNNDGLTERGKLLVQAGFFTTEELSSLLRSGLAYVDLLPASDEEVHNYRVTALRAALGSLAPTPEEGEALLQALMEGGSSAAVNKLAEMIAHQYGAQAAQQYLQRQGDDGKTLQQKLLETFTALKQQFEALGNNLKLALYDRANALLKIAEANPGEPKEGQQGGQQQRAGARPGGGAAGGGAGGRGQPGQGGGQLPPGGWTPYGGRDIPQIANNRLFDPEEGIFGTNDPLERINRIHNRYPEVINQWAQAMGMSPEEWMNRFRSLTRDDARRRWLKQQNLQVTAQKLRTAYLKGLGLNDEQISRVMSMLGDKEACINYLMQALGISREEAEAIYNMLLSLGTEDGIRKYLEKLGYSEEEINAFIEKLNQMKEEKEQYLKQLGLSDEDIEEILGMSKEEAEAKLKELGLTDEQIAEYFAKEDEVRQYLKEEMGIEDEEEIDQILTLNEDEARAYLQNRSLDIDIDEFLALETDEEKLDYLKNYFMEEKGMSEEEATQRAQEIMNKLNEIGDTGGNQPDIEGLQNYFNEHNIDIDLDEFLALGSEDEMLNYLKDYFITNENLSEEEAQARAEEVMNDIKDMLGGAQEIEDKIVEMYNFLDEHNYRTDEFLKEIGLSQDKILEFRRLTEDHARYWFLTDTFENLIAQKNPDMSEEEVKEKAEWLAGLILGQEVKEDMRLIPVSAHQRLREILDAWEEAAKELGLDKQGINDRFRQAVGNIQPQQPGTDQQGQIPQQPGAGQLQPGVQSQVVTRSGQNQIVGPGERQLGGNNVVRQPATNRPGDDEIEAMFERIVDRLIVSLLTGEMFPENAKDVALNIMREESEGFNWGDRDDEGRDGPPVRLDPPAPPIPMPENWTQNIPPWGNGDMEKWFEDHRDQFDSLQQFTAWRQAWIDWYQNLLQQASAVHSQALQNAFRRGTLNVRPVGRGF
jgi:hypothetical protein